MQRKSSTKLVLAISELTFSKICEVGSMKVIL